MTKRVTQHAVPVTPKLVLRRQQNADPYRDRHLDGSIHVLHVNENDYRRASVFLGRLTRELRELSLNDDEGLTHCQSSMDRVAVRAGAPHTDFCVKHFFAELNFFFGIPAHQRRNHSR